MKTLKQLISKYMYTMTCFLVVSMLVLLVYIQVTTEQKRMYGEAIRTIRQIESVLEENQKELAEIEAEYRQTCVHNAETVARIIESNPEVLNSVEELKEIAVLVEVDEIHIFDTTGRIFVGTHPQYFDYTFDSGEQMMFFKPMLEDKSLKLVQDITPNTAEDKPMQYSAIWSENGNFIVQVGMEPVNVMKATEKNELSYIFSLLRVGANANYYAISIETGEIVGSTNLDTVGLLASGIGVDIKKLEGSTKGFHARINGEVSFCVFEQSGENYIGTVVSVENLYQRVPATAAWIFLSLVIVAFILAQSVVRNMNRHVVMKIDEINKKLKSIADGNLDETLNVQSSAEFVELSSYINFMVKSLLEAENLKRRKLERERDIDTLTGLYNRRGLDNRLEQLFTEPEKLGCSAIVMIDGDGLKKINDTYGHEKGDIYLKKIAQTIAGVGTRDSVVSRQGGDEFVLFLYNYESEKELISAIESLEYAQNQELVELDEETKVPLRFSFGYCMVNAGDNYLELLGLADKKMYQNKLQRRGK